MTELRLWRVRERLTLSAAAKRLGMSVGSLWMLESGRLRPSEIQADKLRQGTGIEPTALMRPVRSRIKL